MPGKIIGLIYFYLISAVSIGMLIFAAFSWASLVINLTQYDDYPPRFLAEDCENFGYSPKGPYPMEVSREAQASLSAEEKDRLKKSCEVRLEEDRKQHKLDDIKNSVVFTLVGVVLFLIHFPQARKMSKDK